MPKYNIDMVTVARTSLLEDLRELTAMSAQAARTRQTKDLATHLHKIKEVYLGTRSFSEVAADNQLLANRLYALQQVNRVCDYIDSAVDGIQHAVESFKPVGGTTVETHSYDSRDRLLTKTTGSDGQAIDPYAATNATTKSALSIITSGIRSISAARVDKVRKALGDIQSIETMVENAEGLLEQVTLLINALEEVKQGSAARVRQANLLRKSIHEKKVTEYLQAVNGALAEHFAIYGNVYNHERGVNVTLADLKSNDVANAEYLRWCEEKAFAGTNPDEMFGQVEESEARLCQGIDSMLEETGLLEFKRVLAADIRAIKEINPREFADNSEFTRLATEAGIDPVAITAIVGWVPKLTYGAGGKIDKSDSDAALAALKDGLERCVSVGSSKGVTAKTMAIYLVLKLDKILHKAGIAPDNIQKMGKMLGLPDSASQLFVSFYADSELAVKDDKSMKDTVGKKGGKGGSILFKAYEHGREINAAKKASDQSFAMKKAIVLAVYVYHKLCRHDNIAMNSRSNNNPKNKQLKKLAVEIIAASMEGVDDPEVKKYFDHLRSADSDAAFLTAATSVVGRSLETNSGHKLSEHFRRDGTALLADVPMPVVVQEVRPEPAELERVIQPRDEVLLQVDRVDDPAPTILQRARVVELDADDPTALVADRNAVRDAEELLEPRAVVDETEVAVEADRRPRQSTAALITRLGLMAERTGARRTADDVDDVEPDPVARVDLNLS